MVPAVYVLTGETLLVRTAHALPSAEPEQPLVFEVDRFDVKLGSPTHGLVVATSAGRHTDYYQVTSEDVPVTLPGQGGTESPKVRADMVFFETPNGGAVFSVGSINWLASLAWNKYENNVARLTHNVLARFLDPRPFAMP